MGVDGPSRHLSAKWWSSKITRNGRGIVKLSRRARLAGSVSPASAMDLS
jgi:hypothetical protein